MLLPAIASIWFTAIAHAGQITPPPDIRRPLALGDAIAEALNRSPVLRPVEDGRTLAEVQQELAASTFGFKIVPSFAASADPTGFGHRQLGIGLSKRLLVGTELAIDVGSYRYGSGTTEMRDAGYTVSIKQPLPRGFGPSATYDLRNAARGAVSSERRLTEARQQLVVSTAGAYFAVVRQQRLVEAGERALARAGKLRRASEARASVGLATQLDVFRADLLAAQAQAQLALQREALAGAEDYLKLLLGRSAAAPLALAPGDLTNADEVLRAVGLPPGPQAVGQPLDRTAEAVPNGSTTDLLPIALAHGGLTGPASRSGAGPVERSPQPGAGAADGLIPIALASRLDVREARDRVDDARRTARVARWNLLPQVNLTTSYVQRRLGSPSQDPASQLHDGWRFALTTDYALDRAAETAAERSARIGLRAAEREATDVAERAMAEVRAAYRAVERVGESVRIQQQALELAEKQLRLAELRYERGLADNFDVVDAENNLFQAQTGLIAAEVERIIAGLVLARATGQLDPNRFLDASAPR
ncbi:MAG: TolC family protein [Acidobacteria bacterium]|nr:TolC family protein [Acidobacteriota bacterium]